MDKDNFVTSAPQHLKKDKEEKGENYKRRELIGFHEWNNWNFIEHLRTILML